MSLPPLSRHVTRQASLVVVAAPALAACQRETTPAPAATGDPSPPVATPAATAGAPVELKDVIEKQSANYKHRSTS